MSIEIPATHEVGWRGLWQQWATHLALDPMLLPYEIWDSRPWRQQAMLLGRTLGAHYQAALQLPSPCSRQELHAALAALLGDLGGQLTVRHDDVNEMTLLIEGGSRAEFSQDALEIRDMTRATLCATVAWLYGYARVPLGMMSSAKASHIAIALWPDEVPEAEMAGQFTRREMEELARAIDAVPAAPDDALPPGAINYEHLYHQQVALTGKLERALGIEHAEIEQLRSFTRLKQDFLANVSHEFRTPITTMQGYLTLLRQEALGTLNAEQAEAVQTASRSLERLKQLVNDVLDYSSLTHGKCTLAEERVEITDVLSHAMQLAGAPATAQQITIRSDIHPPVGKIIGDRDKLVRIVAHLLENAVKFSAPGSEVVLTGQRRQDHAEITVRDRGIGMSPGQLQTVFMPFVQGETGLTRRYDGLGLGLSLIRRLVILHGGHISINSALGEGTTVTVALPLQE